MYIFVETKAKTRWKVKIFADYKLRNSKLGRRYQVSACVRYFLYILAETAPYLNARVYCLFPTGSFPSFCTERKYYFVAACSYLFNTSFCTHFKLVI